MNVQRMYHIYVPVVLLTVKNTSKNALRRDSTNAHRTKDGSVLSFSHEMKLRMWEQPTASGCDWRRRTRKKDEERTALERCTTHDHAHTAFHLYIGTHGGEGLRPMCFISLSYFESEPIKL